MIPNVQARPWESAKIAELIAGGLSKTAAALTVKRMQRFVFIDSPRLRVGGGPGSGNFGHAGRPGEIGGSAPAGTARERYDQAKQIESALGNEAERLSKEYDALEDRLIAKLQEGHPEITKNMARSSQVIYDNPELVKLRDRVNEKAAEWEEAGEKANAIKREVNVEIVQERAIDIAQQMGVDPSIIHVVDKDPTPFVVGNQQFKEAGHFDPATGQIEINARNTYDDRMSVTNGVVAHEISHAIYHKARELQAKEHQEITSLPKEESDRLFSASGYARPETQAEVHKRYPVSAMFYRYTGDSYVETEAEQGRLGTDGLYLQKMRRLQDDDGVSAYSRAYWQPTVVNQSGGLERAVNETLAETTRYLTVQPVTQSESDVPTATWMAFVKDLQSVFPKHRALGGPGSGNFGHVGRPGEVGGSGKTGPRTPTEAADLIKAASGADAMVIDHPLALKAATVVADTLQEMKKSGYKMPDDVIVMNVPQQNPAGRTTITRDEGDIITSLMIVVPTDAPDDMPLDTIVAKAFGGQTSVGSAATPNPPPTDKFAVKTFKDVVVHEMGHVQHGLGGRDFSDVSRERNIRQNDEHPSTWINRTARQVSDYATESSHEFVAESFVRLYRGEMLSPDALEMYKFLNGPEVRP